MSKKINRKVFGMYDEDIYLSIIDDKKVWKETSCIIEFKDGKPYLIEIKALISDYLQKDNSRFELPASIMDSVVLNDKKYAFFLQHKDIEKERRYLCEIQFVGMWICQGQKDKNGIVHVSEGYYSFKVV